MRIAMAILAACLALPALGAFDVTATMPATQGATQCQLYLDGSAAGAPKPCGSAQSFPALIENPGVYTFAYKALNASGESALSPATTVEIGVVPDDPTSPPTVTIVCDPSPCPASIVITVTP